MSWTLILQILALSLISIPVVITLAVCIPEVMGKVLQHRAMYHATLAKIAGMMEGCDGHNIEWDEGTEMKFAEVLCDNGVEFENCDVIIKQMRERGLMVAELED